MSAQSAAINAARYGFKQLEAAKAINPIDRKDSTGLIQSGFDSFTSFFRGGTGARYKSKIGSREDAIKRIKSDMEKVTGNEQKEYQDLLEKLKNTGDDATYKWDEEFVDKDLRLSNPEKFAGMFLDKEGNLSKTRMGVGAAGFYVASNIVGNGSPGIPFIG